MIAILLTLACIFFIYVNSENSTTVWVMIGVIALIWFFRMVWIDEAIAHINWIDYWSGRERERTRERRRSANEVPEKKEYVHSEVTGKTDHVVSEQKPQARSKEDEKVVCDSCGRWARIVHKTKYPSGKTYAEYQCPYCGDRKLKFYK